MGSPIEGAALGLAIGHLIDEELAPGATMISLSVAMTLARQQQYRPPLSGEANMYQPISL